MTAILKEDPPDLPVAERHIPPALERIVDRCLEKNPAARFQTANDLGFALEGVSAHSDALVSPPTSRSRLAAFRDVRVAWSVAALLLAVIGATAFALWRPAAQQPVKFAFQVSTPGARPTLFFAVSPLGTHIVDVAVSPPSGTLWVRPLDQLEGQLVTGIDGALLPFWSPDGRYVGFFSGGKLKKIDISGGPAQTIADAPRPQGASWSKDGVILFAPHDSAPLFRVSADGGDPVPVTELDKSRQETGHWHPWFLPDGRHFIYLARSSKIDDSGIYYASLDSRDRKRVMTTPVKAIFAAPAHILFARDNALMAQGFDPERGTLYGDAVLLAESIDTNFAQGLGAFSTSATGVLAYRGSALGQFLETTLSWFDRSGNHLGDIGPPGPFRNPRLSPDGNRVITERHTDNNTADLWLIDLERQVPTRFTFVERGNRAAGPVWSPDGSRIAWAVGTGNGSTRAVFQKPIGGAEKQEKLGDLPIGVLDDWVSGVGILFHDGSGLSGTGGLSALPLDGGAPRMLGDTQSILTHARLSPDGRWLAFTLSDTGRPEIYIQSFPTAAERLRISAAGGIQPVWRRDGKELFFLAPDGKLMVVPMELRPRPVIGTPMPLFTTRIEGGGIQGPGIWHQYDVTSDGRRFLINMLSPQQPTIRELSITVLVNWADPSASTNP
jgi:Tol biopolymer transport system component